MKQTFAFLTFLLIFTVQVFGQVKTINKDGKAIILNDDGTWRYDDSNTENISNKNCSDLITTIADKVTGLNSRHSIAAIILNDGGKSKIEVRLLEVNSIIGILFLVEGASRCIDDTNEIYILFRDGTRLVIENDAKYNCDGEFKLYFNNIHGKKKILETISTKEIETIRIWTRESYVEQDLTPENSKELIMSLNCLISNNVNKGFNQSVIAPIKNNKEINNSEKPLIYEVGITADIDGNQYPIFQIGTNIWMAGNLRVTRFNNGDQITEIIKDEKWSNTRKTAWSMYDNSLKYGKPLGYLYNGNAVLDERNICPSGWHVPTDSDWENLIKTLGGPKEAGIKLRATKGWLPTMNGTNVSGMKLLPSGSRNENGQFYGAGKVGVWWSSTNDPSGVKLFTRTLSNDKQEVIKFAANPKIGAYVRCIRD